MMMAMLLKLASLVLFVAFFVCLNNLVFRVRVPVSVCVGVCVLMNNKAILQ